MKFYGKNFFKRFCAGTAAAALMLFTCGDFPVREGISVFAEANASATPVTADDTAWMNGTYTVSGNVELSNRVEVNGTVTLILEAGCKLTANKGITVANDNKLTIKGEGELEATGGDYEAGIGGEYGGNWCNCGTITIESGTITANGGEQAAGIGGGADTDEGGSGGTVIIRGGTVTATGGTNGAGIGSGYYSDSGHSSGTGGSSGNITIENGTVIANGGTNGAGIGGGNGFGGKGNGDTITISGGTVNATGGWSGAGIGGGNRGSGGNITISGGNVTANGGNAAAGIGGGYSGSKSTINITGGTVKATGDGSGAGIGSGGGNTSDYGPVNVTISGGTVTAIGGSGSYYGAGIGNGALAPDTAKFSTDNGNAFIVATSGNSRTPSISDNDDTSSWSGVIFQGNAGQVYGSDYTLKSDATIPSGATLTIPENTTVTINEGATLTNNGTITNNGTLTVDGGTLNGGTISGSGTCSTAQITDDMISVPTNLIYNGKDLSDTIAAGTKIIIGGKEFTAEGWTKTVTKVSDILYTVTYSKDSVSVSKNVSVAQSGAILEAELADNKTEYAYSDTITINTTIKPTGEAPAVAMLAADFDELTAGQIAVYEDDKQVCAPATPENGVCTFNIPAKDLGVGEHTLTVKYIASDVMAEAEYNVTVTVKPAILTITGATLTAKTYDGTTTATVTGVTFDGYANGDSALTASDYTATAEFTDANAGTDKTAIVTVTIADTVTNYTLAENAFQLENQTIDKAEVTLTFEDQTITYGETPAPAMAESAAEITYSYVSGSDTVNGLPKNAGTYTVTAAVAETDNYNGATKEITLTINPKTVSNPTITLSESSFEYDGNAKTPTVTVKDGETVISSDEYTVEYSNNTGVGTATVTIKDVDGGNYVINGTAHFEITKASQAALTITGKPESIVYGDSFTLGTTGGSGDGAVTWEVTAGNAAITSGGAVTVTGTGDITVTVTKAEDGNYQAASATLNFTAERRPITITGAALAAKTYDGTTSATVTDVTFDGVLESDGEPSYTATAVFTNANAGTDKTATVTVTLADTVTNYTLTQNTFTLTEQTIAKAANPPTMPESTMTVDFSHKTAGSVTLPSGWTWSNPDTPLTVGSTVDAEAVYTSPDKDNYENITVTVAVTRQECMHDTAEYKHDETNHWQECGICGEKINTASHNWTEEVTKQATCTAEGTLTKTCADCKRTETEAIPMAAHTEEIVSGTPATCLSTGLTDGKKCSVCGTVITAQEIIPATGHIEEIVPAVAPTCTETGLTEGKKCSVCHTIIVAQQVIPAAGHTEEIIPAVPADCTTTGLTEGKRCSVCGVPIKEQTVTAALGHKWDSGIVTVQPDEENDGLKVYTCTVCGETKNEVISKLNHTHTPDITWDSDNDSHWKNCSGCAEKLEFGSHTWDGGIVNVQPTESAEGVRTYNCLTCGKTKTEAVPKLDHTHTPNGAWLFDDHTHWHNCTGCTEKLDTAAHIWDDGVITTQPTESSEGVKTYTCSVCGTAKTEPIGKLDHTHKFDAIWHSDRVNHWHECVCGEKSDISAHTEDGGTVTRPATTEETGIMTYSCAVCGYKLREETIDKLPDVHTHEYGTTWISNSTSHWHECVCGVKSDISAHTEDGGTVTRPATTEETGIMTYSCAVCGYKLRDEIIEKLPPVHTHEYSMSWNSDSTNHWHECVCGEKSDISAHTADNGTVTVRPTENAAGTRTFKCTVCGYVIRTETIPPTGYRPNPTPTPTPTPSPSPSPVVTTEGKNENVPYIEGNNGKRGWEAISEEIIKTGNTGTVTVDMNGTTELPKNITEEIAGKDIDLVLDMGGGISWTINGLTVTNPKAVDMSVTKNTKNIPVDVVNNVSGESFTMLISLAHNGEFGFTAELNIELGRKNDGLFANLFYYNKGKERLEFVDCGFIENGVASIEFTHASDYAIVIDSEPLGGFEDVAAGAGAYEIEDNLPQTAEKNNTVCIAAVSITIVITAVCAVWFVSKKKKNR